jgi:hypothetical protein
VLISLWLFLFAAQPKEFFLDGLKKLEHRSRKCVELTGEYVNTFFNPVACFLHKAKDLSALLSITAVYAEYTHFWRFCNEAAEICILISKFVFQSVSAHVITLEPQNGPSLNVDIRKFY